MAELPELQFEDDLPELHFEDEKPKPMFATEAEGREAMKVAEQDLAKAKAGASPMGVLLAQSKAVEEPINRAANSAMFGIPGITSELLSGGKLVNPLTHGLRVTEGGTNAFDGKGMTEGQKTMADIAGALLPAKAVLSFGKSQVGKYIKNIKDTKSAETADLAHRTRTAFSEAKQNAVKSFGDDIDNLAQSNSDRTISLREQVEAINLDPDMAPEAKAIFRRTPFLRDMINDPNLADNVTLKQVQEISNYINAKVPKTVKANHLDILDTLNDIRAKQLDAFPEMGEVRAKYGAFKESYNTIKNDIKARNILKSIETNFKDPVGKEAARGIMKTFDSKLLNDLENYKRSVVMLKIGGILGKGALGAAGVGAVAGVGTSVYKSLE